MIEGGTEGKLEALGTNVRASMSISVTYTDEEGVEQTHVVQDDGPFIHLIFAGVKQDGPKQPIMALSLGDLDAEFQTLAGILAQTLQEGHHALGAAMSELMTGPQGSDLWLAMHGAHIKTAMRVLEDRRAREKEQKG